MPGLDAFGRRWMIGSDDLIFPFASTAATRLIWLVIISIVLGIYHHFQHVDDEFQHPNSCRATFGIYLFGYIGILAFSLLLDVVISIASSLGSIYETERRKNIPLFLYIRVLFWIIELIWIIIGIKWIFIDNKHCAETTDKSISKAVVLFNIVLLLILLVIMYLFFDTRGKLYYKKETGQQLDRAKYGSLDFSAVIKKKNQKDIVQSLKRLLCCSRKGDSGNHIVEFIARILSEHMGGYEDLVPSDVLAGLVLLRRQQKYEEARTIESQRDRFNSDHIDRHLQRYRTVKRVQCTADEKPFCLDSEVDMKTLDDINHYFKYAVAIYGWLFYVFNHCGSPSCCKIFSNLSCCCCCQKAKTSVIEDDNCCLCSYGAAKLMGDLKDEDIIYISHHSNVFQTPFCCVMDHKRRCIVLSCRGTMSLQDVLTDCMIEAEPIPVEGGSNDWLAHRGILAAALQILDTIKKNQVLETAFNSDIERGTKDYNLVLVGHSLGAGTASILAFLLRPRFPNLICFAYSTPGAMFNDIAAKESEKFITSVVVGKDVIARLSLHTLEDLRHKIVSIIKETRLPKWKILRGCVCQCMLCCQSSVIKSHEDYLDFEPYTLAPFQPSNDVTKMYIAGKVVHVVKTNSHYPKVFGRKKADYKALWGAPSDYQSILISNLMWKDHMPENVLKVLNDCTNDYHQEKQKQIDKESSCSFAEEENKPPPSDSVIIKVEESSNESNLKVNNDNEDIIMSNTKL